MAPKEEDAEYESDPEDAPLPTMRRREASDDEQGEESEGRGKSARGNLRAGVGSDDGSDGQGGAEVYDDEEEEEEYYDDEEDDLGDEVEEVLRGRGGGETVGGEGGNLAPVAVGGSTRESGKSPEPEGDGQKSGADPEENQRKNQLQEEEKKQSEPYAVPTAGAFYMHDDRFQENGRGRHRRMFGGRKLWDPKDERAWVHDRFEEMNLHDTRRDEERQRYRGRFRGRGGGKSRGAEVSYIRGNRSRTYLDDVNNQNRAPRTVRGRGPRRYEPIPKGKRDIPAAPATQNSTIQSKQSSLCHQEYASNDYAGRQFSQAASVQSEPIPPRKNTFASSLNSASPPFYPSGSSNQDIALTQKRDVQTGRTIKAIPYSTNMEDNSSASQSNSLLRGKILIDMAAHDMLYMDNSPWLAAGKTAANSILQSSGPSLSSKEAIQSASSRAQGRGLSTAGALISHSESPLRKVGRVAAQIKSTAVEQRPVQVQLQPAMQISTQQLVQPSSNGNQASATPQPPSANSSEVGETDSPPGSSKSKVSPVGKARISNQGTGRGSFRYGGTQVIGATGAMGLAHGDQNFPGTPALLPVMQLGGQHPGGIGVPALGMALPGYVAQSQLGFRNSEMTWVPVLTGGAGALGASYCPPYIALDGNYYARPSGQASSSASSRETSTNKPANSLRFSQSPEVGHEELGQRQNKPRRYSEMNFGQ